MWTKESRARYDRSALRYPSDLTDGEWSVLAPLIPPVKHGGRPRAVDIRAVIGGLLYVLETVSVRGRGGISAVSARRAECPRTWSPARA